MMVRMIGILVTVLAMMPVMGSTQERIPTGLNVCAEENPGNLGGRNACYDEWRRSAVLVNRYFNTYVSDEARGGASAAFWETFKSGLFRNPYKLNRFNLFGNCNISQVFSGDFLDDKYDFRPVWACIARHDKEAAKWDMI